MRLAFETARAANPDAFLLLNDFNMSSKYTQLIEDCLEAGMKIDAIGLQSHMHQGYWGEERQADEIRRHCTTLVSHPAVDATTYWGFDGAWLGAPVGLAQADGTLKPSYGALYGLVRGEWRTPPTTVRTDADGWLRLAGFRGTYRVSAAGNSAGAVLDADPAVQETSAALPG